MRKILSIIFIIGIMSLNTACDKMNFFGEKKIVTQAKKTEHKNVMKHAQNARKKITKIDSKQEKPEKNELAEIIETPIIEQSESNNKTQLGSIRRKKELNIGIFLPLSGQYAKIGQNMLDAAQLASSELGTEKINIVAVDIGSTKESAARILSNTNNKLDVIIGPVIKDQVEIVNRYSRTENITQIALVNDKDFSHLGNLFMLGMPIEQQMSRLISYVSQKGVKNIYTIIPNNSLGESIEALLLNYKDSNEIRDFLTIKYNYSKDANDINFSQAAQELRDKMSKIENYAENSIILLPQSDNELRKISQRFEMMNDSNLKKMKVICGSQFHDSSPYAITWAPNPWFADVSLDKRAAFASRFKAANKYVPHNTASLAYDAVALILAVVEQSRNGLLVFDPNSLINKTGFEGVNGVFRFLSDGSEERLLAVFKIEANQVIEIDPALPSFE